MVHSQIINIDVAFLTYNPNRRSDKPSVKQDDPCVVGAADLKAHGSSKRKHKAEIGPEAYDHYKWYNLMLSKELRGHLQSSKLRISHWYIESGNTEAFKMGGVVYRAISIIVTPDLEHWFCSNTGPDGSSSYGSRYRSKQEIELEKNMKKIAKFTIDDDEALLVISPTDNDLRKCTAEVCANNCTECKKQRSPFTNTNKFAKCVCFPPQKDDFKSINDSDVDLDTESDEDIANLPSIYTAPRMGSLLNPRFALNAIREESFNKETN